MLNIWFEGFEGFDSGLVFYANEKLKEGFYLGLGLAVFGYPLF